VHILCTIIIGFVAGIIAKFLHPGRNEPKGFILTTLLGIAGAFLATYTPRRSESPHFEFIGSAAGT
jgi:uncharacterized membrane protein YeaQ/YmgE (transglycosylase-associated protein family)